MSIAHNALWFVIGLLVGWLAVQHVIPLLVGFVPVAGLVAIVSIVLQLLLAYLFFKWHRPMAYGYILYIIYFFARPYIPF